MMFEILETIRLLSELAAQANKENREPTPDEVATTLARVQAAVDRNRSLDPKNA
jgi:hypothetical protein